MTVISNATNPISTGAMEITAISSNQVRRMLGLSLHSWENAMVISLIIAGLFALIAGVSTWAVVRLQRVEIAEANARQSEAELKLAQLRQLAGPRSLNFDTFKKELEGKPKARVAIWYLPDVSDAYSFASRLEGALISSGWQVEGYGPQPIPDAPHDMPIVRDLPRAMVAGGQPSGVTIVGDLPMGSELDLNADTPFNALFRAIMKSTDFLTFGAGGSQFMPVPKGTLRVIVAAKIDPIFADRPPAATSTPK